MIYEAFCVCIDDFDDGFGIRQVVSYQAAILILWIFDFMDVLLEIYKIFTDLIQINFIGIKF